MMLKNIGILGASFNTGNLGVSALGYASIKLILDKWPEACVGIIGSGLHRGQSLTEINGRQLKLNDWPVRFCSNPFARDHYWKLLLGVLFVRIFPYMRSFFSKRQSTFGFICRSDMVADISGGDSFSDIYGMKRFLLGYLTKRLCQLTGRPLVMLPQTYGPIKSRLARNLARRVLKKATRIYSRDKEGTSFVENIISETDKLSLIPDVAFVLEAKAPERSVISNQHLSNLLFGSNKSRVVGLNISGLLYNNGYTGSNEFGLKCAYRELVKGIVTHFSALPDTNVLLVPHVVTDKFEIENDLNACRRICDSLSADVREKVLIAEPDDQHRFFDQCEIKYIIGKCDFFMGSRMHATIAAISQCIPTAGLAYSKKFAGVYETVGIDDCVVDLRHLENGKVLDRVKSLFEKSNDIKQRLETNIKTAKENVFRLFDNF